MTEPEEKSSQATSAIFGQLTQFLTDAGLLFEVVEANKYLRVSLALENARYDTMFVLAENNVLALTVHSFRVPASKRGRILDIVNRINYDLALGNFEFDSKEGEVRYRVGYPHSQKPLPIEFMGTFVYMGFGMMNQFWPAIQAVCWTNISIEQALQDALSHPDGHPHWDPEEDEPNDN